MTITGANLLNATAVTFGNTPVTTFVSDTAGQIVLNAPPHAAGTVNVTVTTPGGMSLLAPTALLTYSTTNGASASLLAGAASTAGLGSLAFSDSPLSMAEAADAARVLLEKASQFD